MPLTNFQAKLAQILAVNRSPDSYLAGGAALHFEPQSLRFSNDLDYFHDTEKKVAEAFNLDQQLLIKNLYTIELEMHQPGFVRAIVRKDNEATKVEWAHDSAWRFMPCQLYPDRGFALHPIDLATNKLLALVGRDEARDYLDIHDIHQRILPLGGLCWAACGKDPGFTPFSLLEILKRRGKYHPEDFTRLNLNVKIDLPLLKNAWLKMLENAVLTINSLPSQELGCLYYSQVEKKFVEPPLKDRPSSIVPHFGKMGGVLPKIYNL